MNSLDAMLVKWDYFKRVYNVWVITRSEGDDLLAPDIQVPIEVFTDHEIAHARAASLDENTPEGRKLRHHVHRVPIYGHLADEGASER